MPRKKLKTEKEPLRFREQHAGGARVQYNVPEVRAALNPKDFFRATQEHDGSTLNSWVNPQFDTSSLAVLPTKKRRCPSSACLRNNVTQLSRKGSVCSKRFPSLLFDTKSREPHRQKERRKASDDGTSSASKDSSHKGFCQNTNATCKREMGKKDFHQNDDIKAPDGRRMRMCKIPSFFESETFCVSSEVPSSHPSKDNANVSPAPLDVITPKITEENSTNSHALNLLFSPPSCSPSSSSRIWDILVPDTPERDYGVKVTWQRRRRLMLLLKERGHLSDSDSMIHI